MRTSSRRLLSLLLTTLLILSALTGCAKPDPAPSAPADAAAVQPTADPALFDGATPIPAPAQPAFAEGSDVTVAMPEASPEPVVDELAALTDTQRNSINMLNHLVVLTQQINTSQNSLLFLEDTYSSLLNNTNPEMVSYMTLNRITEILDNLHKYRMLAEKQERLQYMMERQKAQTFLSILPNPLYLLNISSTETKEEKIVAIATTALSSLSQYISSDQSAELNYLSGQWEIEDEGRTILHNAYVNSYRYMVNIVNANKLPGSLALNTESVVNFVKKTSGTNKFQIKQFLESEKETYQGYSGYWLVLAQTYYDTNEYAKCLEAIAAYEALNVQIFRKDYKLAEVMPLAIISAGRTLEGEAYVTRVDHFLDILTNNIDRDDWAPRYFAAQVYINLYSLTNDEAYLRKAYNQALITVNELADEQKEKNAIYIADLQYAELTKGSTNQQRNDIKQYNKMIKEQRKTELVPIVEPLVLNCDLLFALANQLELLQSDTELLDGILHEDGSPLFLCKPIDNRYYLSKEQVSLQADIDRISFTNDKKLLVPVSLINDQSTISITISSVDNTTAIDDWSIDQVERKEKENLNSFTAIFASTTASKYNYQVGDVITITITPKSNSDIPAMTIHYHAVATKTLGIFNGISFEKRKQE